MNEKRRKSITEMEMVFLFVHKIIFIIVLPFYLGILKLGALISVDLRYYTQNITLKPPFKRMFLLVEYWSLPFQ